MCAIRNKYHSSSGRHCQVDEHLLASHAYSDKFGGSTTLLRCASAVVGDHKSAILDEQYVIPLDDLCPCYQHVHLVAPHTDTGDDYRISTELELPDRSLGVSSAYDRFPMSVSSGLAARTMTTVARNSRSNSRRSFVTFKPQTTAAANVVATDSSPEGTGTAPTGSCASLDLIKPTDSRASSSTTHEANFVAKSQEDSCRSSDDPAVSSGETFNAVG